MSTPGHDLRHATSQRAKAADCGKSLLVTALCFVSIYPLMYAMVDTPPSVYAKVNQLFMAGLMTAAMAHIELALMSPINGSKKSSSLILGVRAIAGIAEQCRDIRSSQQSQIDFMKANWHDLGRWPRADRSRG